MQPVVVSNIIAVFVMVMGFVGNALYFKGSFTARLDNNEQDVVELKDRVQFKDNCNERSSGLDTRIHSLEELRNGNHQ